MPELRITESQLERFNALQEELAAEHAGPYASVRQQDVLDYLLDLAEEVDDPAESLEADAKVLSGSTETDPGDGDEPKEELADGETPPAGDPATTERGSSESTTDGAPGGMLNLLERHGDKWREASGEERYEVELEDGSLKTARTKDDVKAILFRHY